MFPHLSKFNLQQWIEENRGNWGRRRTVWEDSDFITVVHRGPNRGKQFHINEGDEIFYQLEGELNFHYINSSDKREVLVLKPGEMFLLPANVPHSPRRKKGHGLWSSNASAGLRKSIGGIGFVKSATTSSTRRRRDPAKDPAIKQISQSKTPTSDSEPTSLLAPANAAAKPSKSRTST
jgi:mannose-6-phosphate isomerase-like protein (cupin superfamily)